MNSALNALGQDDADAVSCSCHHDVTAPCLLQQSLQQIYSQSKQQDPKHTETH